MANTQLYKKFLDLNSAHEIKQEFQKTLVATNRSFLFYVNWKKVKKNVDAIKTELSLLDSLINSKYLKQDFNKLLLKYPDQSWLADYRWNPKGIAGDELRKVYKTFGGAIGIIIFFIPFNWFAFFTKDIPSIFAVFVGFFDFFIILGLAYGSYLFLRFLKYGTSFLQFNQFPFFLDDKVDAVLNTEAIKGLKDMVVTLRCIEEKYETRGTGRNRSTVIVSYQIYADSVKFDNAGQSQHMRLYLPVSFPLPRDLNYNTALSVRPAKYWQMELKAATPGINYLSTFLIPVYVRNG